LRLNAFAYRTKTLSTAAAFIALGILPVDARDSAAPTCDAPFAIIRLTNPLVHVAERLKSDKPITIVAIGSSSTAGVGASSQATSYPSRLAAELTKRFPSHSITVLNQGVPGEEVGDMLKRLETAVIAAKPDLVLWQFGTNSVIRNDDLSRHEEDIHKGLTKIRSSGADVVLIDPQFAPKVTVKQGAARTVELIASTAKREDINLFPRFELMKRWHDVDHMDFSAFISSDGLHMNDWSYGCLAKALSISIFEAAHRPVLSATVMPHTLH
jgi:acyl-CoA thioesterase I